MAIIGSLALAPTVITAQEGPSLVEQGKKVAFDRRKGNCLACHAIAGGDLPGTIGPPLIAMKARYPDKSKLRAQIYDARLANPGTSMPPYGPHGILSNEEIDKIVEFIYTL
ncbi:MAG: sulfur oxidation c-type cytochrome SoxX [Chromatiales bacterium]